MTADERLLKSAASRKALNDLHDKPLNFDLSRRDEFTPERGWKIDEYCQPLPTEPAGPPVSDGAWHVARRLVARYEFADPRIVRAVYRPERPLAERDMLLHARFYGLTFHLGVRVGGVVDDTCLVDGRMVRVWGWNYRTLQNHLEMGQMDFEVWKWLDDGAVEFRISSFSRPATIPNPLVRLGFRLFGRHMQVKFARRACERIRRLTVAGLGQSNRSGEHILLARDNMTVASDESGQLSPRNRGRRGGQA